ncbi:hypothetical protein F5Y04DRAFT_284394 [Hypomontagnella monticulosa]|nr:hypothetical protein F5Y04DRAFT_284394 [Hypomontagnella monticulosa]
MMGSVGMVFGQCQPSNSQWDFSVPARFCWDKWISVDYTRGACAFSAFVDFYLSIYPGVVLYKIQLPTKKKIALSAALGIGSICDLTIWTIVEGSVIIIAACIPLLQPLLERVRNHPWSTKGSSQSTNLTPSGHQGYADIELSDKSRIRKIRRKFEMDSVLATKNNDEEARETAIPTASQERILEEDECRLANKTAGSQSHDNCVSPNTSQKIYRSDEIRIDYARDEESGLRSHRYQDDWA